MILKLILFLAISNKLQASPEPLESYRSYWSSFDEYEEVALKNKNDKLIENWEKVREEYQTNLDSNDARQIEVIQQTITKYENEIKINSDANITSDIHLNLATLNNDLANILKRKNNDRYKTYKKTALNHIAAIEKDSFSKRNQEQALYLKATILSGMTNIKSSLNSWKKLANKDTKSPYIVAANIALGDFYFSIDESKISKDYFLKAQTIQKRLKKTSTIEKTRVLYRIAWAAYRNSDLGLVIRTSFQLLNPEKHYSNIKIKNLIAADAVDLISHSLFERNDISFTEQTLSKNSLKSKMSEVALSLIQKYAAVDLDNDVSEIGLFTLSRTSLSPSTPQVMWLTALALKKQGMNEEYLAQLKEIVALSNKTSLWRVRNRRNRNASAELDKISTMASKRLASHYYKYAMTHNSPTAYKASAEYFTISDRSRSTFASSLKIANAHFLSNDLTKAVKAYDKIIRNPEVTKNEAKQAHYQKAVAVEKKWRMIISNEMSGDDEKTLNELSETINNYANKYNSSLDQKDLLKLLATTYQDAGKYKNASQVWDRILLTKPSTTLRAASIRGITLANIKTEKPDTVISKIGDFLELENWKKLPKSLELELLGILQEYIWKKSKNLKNNERGKFLVKMALTFPKIPNQVKTVESGAYNFAKNKNWMMARKVTSEFIDKYPKKASGSLEYLLAKSDDYLLDFEKAAEEYLMFAEKNPKHPEVEKALERAVRISEYNEDYTKVMSTCKKIIKITKSNQRKKQCFMTSARYQLKENRIKQAVSNLKSASKITSNEKDKLKLDIEIASHLIKYDKKLGKKLLDKNIRKIRKVKRKLGPNMYRDLLAQAYLVQIQTIISDLDKQKIREDTTRKANLIKSKLKTFSSLMRNVNKIVKTGSSKWSAQARYQAAIQAEQISAELRLVSLEKSTTNNDQKRFMQRARRLKKFARKLYSQNIMAEKRYANLKNSNWVKKSHLKLSGFKKSSTYSYRKMFDVNLNHSRYY